jgi:hypothetical protein
MEQLLSSRRVLADPSTASTTSPWRAARWLTPSVRRALTFPASTRPRRSSSFACCSRPPPRSCPTSLPFYPWSRHPYAPYLTILNNAEQLQHFHERACLQPSLSREFVWRNSVTSSRGVVAEALWRRARRSAARRRRPDRGWRSTWPLSAPTTAPALWGRRGGRRASPQLGDAEATAEALSLCHLLSRHECGTLAVLALASKAEPYAAVA